MCREVSLAQANQPTGGGALTDGLLLLLGLGDVDEALREHEPVTGRRDLAALCAERIEHLGRALYVPVVAQPPASQCQCMPR